MPISGTSSRKGRPWGGLCVSIARDIVLPRARSDRRLSVDLQLFQLVTQRADGDAQLRCCLGLVVAAVFQCLDDGIALELLAVVGQAAGRCARRREIGSASGRARVGKAVWIWGVD